MKLYCIPGLGADKRVFHHIRLPEGFEMVHLDWLEPAVNESLENYARRMAVLINRDEPWGLMGLSFGGMVAAEINNLYNPEVTILISSAQSSLFLPPYYKIVRPLKLYKVFPVSLLKNLSFVKRLFTTETSRDKALLRRIIRESNPAFIRWAIGAIVNWKSSAKNDGIYHIHGTRDILLPFKYVRATHTINGGGHLMVFNRAEEINKVLGEILSSPYICPPKFEAYGA